MQIRQPQLQLQRGGGRFLLSALHHVSDTDSNLLTIRAVKQGDSSVICAPAFVDTSKTLTLGCSYANPTTGTLPVTLDGVASRVGRRQQ